MAFQGDAFQNDAFQAEGNLFRLDAVLFGEQAASFTLDAELVDRITGSFTLDAVIVRTQPGALSLDATLLRTGQPGSRTLDAVLEAPTAGSFTLDATFIFQTTLDAVLQRTITGSFALRAWLYAPRVDPGGPGEPGETPMVSIMVDEVDITADVLLQDCEFTMLVNGGVGNCHLRVRDDGHTYNFVSGSEITVDVDGKRRFGGFIMQPKRTFAFDVEDTTDPERPSRYHDLTGVDYNILMVKRVLYDPSDLTNMELRSWPEGSDDDVVIKYVFDHYTDLPADGVTYNGVTHIASPNPDRAGIIGSAGLYFIDAMREINRLISGVFYIDAYKDLNFVDVDIPDTTVELSDNPSGGLQVGYRQFSRTENATNMVNDAMVWGTAQGARRMAFSRTQDAASIAAHGRWQKGEFTTSLYRQASVDQRAATMVNGTAQSLRGGKNDQVSWVCTTFDNRFEVGQRVAIESEVFGHSDVVPIRRLTMTFPTKSLPKFDLTLSHEIDDPWNMHEFLPWPRFAPWDLDFDIDVGDIDIDFPEIGGCTCGITDTFSSVVIGWAAVPDDFVDLTPFFSEGGPPWQFGYIDSSVGGTGVHEVRDGVMRFRSDGGVDDARVEFFQSLGPWAATSYSGAMTVDFWIPEQADDPMATFGSSVSMGLAAEGGGYLLIDYELENRNLRLVDRRDVSPFDSIEAEVSFEIDTTRRYTMRLEVDTGAEGRVKIWAEDESEPEDWTLTIDISSHQTWSPQYFNFFLFPPSGDVTPPVEVLLDNLDIEGVNRCTAVQFDDFERTLTSGWGSTTSGLAWQTANPSALSNRWSVSVGQGRLVKPSGAVDQGEHAPYVYDPAGPWTTSSWEMLATIRTNDLSRTQLIDFLFMDDELTPSNSDLLRLDPDTPQLLLFSSGSGSGSDSVAYSSWANNTPMYVKIQKDATGIRAKVWNTTSAEPGWLVEHNDPNTVSLPYFMTKQATDSFPPSAITLRYDSIEFTYDGQPCFSECDGVLSNVVIEDTFTRTVGHPEWGTSDSGHVWDTYTFPNIWSDDPIIEVDDGIGRIYVQHPHTLDRSAEDSGAFLQGSAPGVGASWMATWRFRLTSQDLTNTEITPFIDFAYGAANWNLEMGASDYVDHGQRLQVITFGASPNFNEFFGYFLTTGVWYRVRWDFVYGGQNRLKIWNEASDEPASWTIVTNAVTSASTNQDFNVYVEQGGSDATNLGVDLGYEMDDLQIGDACTSVSTPPGDGGVTGGAGRTDYGGNGFQAIFTTPTGYQPGSVRAYVDGYFMRPGIDFTETDPEAGTVTFSTAPAGGASVSLFYEVARL